jgi:flagellar hook assembly protein FlgD
MRNPCSGDVSFRVATPGAVARAKLQVFDLSGRLVRTLLDGRLDGPRDIHWNGRDAHGSSVASGIYFVRLFADGDRVHRKLVVVR